LSDRVRLIKSKTETQERESVLKNGALANKRLQPTLAGALMRPRCVRLNRCAVMRRVAM